jgi:hypothetical protein
MAAGSLKVALFIFVVWGTRAMRGVGRHTINSMWSLYHARRSGAAHGNRTAHARKLGVG